MSMVTPSADAHTGPFSAGLTTEVKPPSLASDRSPVNSIAPSAQPTSDVDTPPITVSLLVRHPSTESGAAKVNTVAGGTVVVGTDADVVGETGGAVVATAATVVSADSFSEPDDPQALNTTNASPAAAVTIARRRITRM